MEMRENKRDTVRNGETVIYIERYSKIGEIKREIL